MCFFKTFSTTTGAMFSPPAPIINSLIRPVIDKKLSEFALENEIGNGIPLCYIFCTDPVYKSLESSREIVRKMNWPIFELHAGHDAMYTDAKETLNLLMKICN